MGSYGEVRPCSKTFNVCTKSDTVWKARAARIPPVTLAHLTPNAGMMLANGAGKNVDRMLVRRVAVGSRRLFTRCFFFFLVFLLSNLFKLPECRRLETTLCPPPTVSTRVTYRRACC